MSILDSVTTALFGKPRKIAAIVPNVVIEESHQDNLTITDHPVEQGASISDHAYKNPVEVTCKYGWSDSSLLMGSAMDFASGLLQGNLNGASNSALTIDDVYQKLLDLQATRQPFDLTTGKRKYSNMLIKSIGVTTDAATENSLLLTAVMKQVIIVQTQAVVLQPSENHATPSSTGPTQNTGTKQPQANSTSLIYRWSPSL